MSEHHDRHDLPDIWQTRFAFFRRYGLPSSTPEARAAFKALPWGARFRLNSNILAFLFGPFYFFAKGMWRKGLTLLLAAVALGAALTVSDIPDTWARAIGLGFAAAMSTTANYAFYLHALRGSRSWNPLQGFGRRAARTEPA